MYSSTRGDCTAADSLTKINHSETDDPSQPGDNANWAIRFHFSRYLSNSRLVELFAYFQSSHFK